MRQKPFIIVRGGGDLATGTIHRLWAAGFPVLVLETDHPAAIRRQVAVCEAVYEGREIVPIQFLKALLPDPASLGPRTVGKTNIGCIFTGKKDGKEKTIYIYNVCDHQECYKEVGSQAISYTTGVPAMIGAALVVDKVWDKDGVFNIEEFDPDPFMDMLNQYGLPWIVDENPKTVE